jgi:hypothetical protein
MCEIVDNTKWKIDDPINDKLFGPFIIRAFGITRCTKIVFV